MRGKILSALGLLVVLGVSGAGLWWYWRPKVDELRLPGVVEMQEVRLGSKVGGRVIAVVPCRSGLWARLDRTPFGHGRPFSRGQLGELMREALFSPVYWTEALFIPPFQNRTWLHAAGVAEQIGTALSLPWAGVLIVEATKLLYLPAGARRSLAYARARQPVLVPGGAPV